MNILTLPIVSTAIAIVVSWALFAIFTSLVQEAIAQIKAERGRFMKNYLLKQLLDRPNGVNWGSMLYMHGPIDLLTRDPSKPTNDIPARTFAESIIEVVGNSHLVRSQPATFVSGYQNPLLHRFASATQLLLPSDVVGMFQQAFTSAELKAGGKAQEAAVYTALVENLQTWYDGLQGRLSLWYQKKTRQRLFIVGILLGALFNVDSVELFSIFNGNPTSRQAVIRYYEQHYMDQAQTGALPDSSDRIREVQRFAHSMDSLSQAASLPIGPGMAWKGVHDSNGDFSFGAFLTKLAGILITGFAASFGAPFWFDLLRKVYKK